MIYSARPNRTAWSGQRGWTLLELLVVMAIIGLLAVISIPVTRMFSRNDLRDGARTIYTMLRAARMYAMTYNVEAAVIYSLDYPFERLEDGSAYFDPLEDSILMGDAQAGVPLTVRAIRSAAVMYRLPDAFNASPILPEGILAGDAAAKYQPTDSAQAVTWREAGTFVPTPSAGEFRSLPQGYAIPLSIPYDDLSGQYAGTPGGALGVPLYVMDWGLPNYNPETRAFLMEYNRQMEYWEKWDANKNEWRPSLDKIGMRPIYVYPVAVDIVENPDGSHRLAFDRSLIRPYIAHVFNPDGSLKVRVQNKERYRIMVAPDPETVPEERVVEIPDPVDDSVVRFSALGIPIEINRSSGAARLSL